MRAGYDRTTTPYVWPSSIQRPDPKTAVVYLDLNHWVALAKANSGHPDGRRYEDSLKALHRARDSGLVLLPIGNTHYGELFGIKNPRHRLHVATVMEELSGFATLLSHFVVITLELEAVLDQRLGPRPDPYVPLPLIGSGVGHAFGVVGGLRIKNSDGDTTEQLRQSWSGGPDAFDHWFRAMNMEFERRILAGPMGDDEIEELLAYGWNPLVAREGQERRAQQERELQQRLDADPKYRRGRLRDVVAARYVLLELTKPLSEGLHARRTDFDEIWPDISDARSFVDSMPSGDGFITLMAAAHRNPEQQWRANDMFDIDAMSVAVAYCDFVATEKHRCHILRQSGICDRLDAEAYASLDELCASIL